MRFYLILFFMYCSSQLYAQSFQHEQIDRVLDLSGQQFAEGNLLESLKLSEQAQNLSEKIDYSKGKSMVNIYIANLLIHIGAYDEVFYFLRKASIEPFFRLDLPQQVEFHQIRGRLYFNRQLYKLSVEEYEHSLSLSKKLENPYERNLYSFISYYHLSYLFLILGKDTDAQEQIEAMEKLLKSIQIDDGPYLYGMYYLLVSKLHLSKNDFQKATLFIDRAMSVYQKYSLKAMLSNPANKYGDFECVKCRYPSFYDLLNQYGQLEFAMGKKAEAVKYYKLALNDMLEQGDTLVAKSQCKLLSNFFSTVLPDKEQVNTYLIKYQGLNDSLDTITNQIARMTVDNRQEMNKDERSSTMRYLFAVMGFLVALVIVIIYYSSYKRRKKIVIKKDTHVLEEKDVIQKHEMISEETAKRVEDHRFTDLVQLAKTNSPEFIVLFKEVYPEFVKKLKSMDPKIRSTELSFCAMAYLNFSTKDIAEYTFVTVRAVQIRKNRIRKKYGIASEEDFNSWMRRLTI